MKRDVFPGGCFFAHLLGEYDAQSGPIHNRVEVGQRGFIDTLEGLIDVAKQNGELDAAGDSAQMAFELYAPLELANFLSTLYRDKTSLERARQAVRSTINSATPRNES